MLHGITVQQICTFGFAYVQIKFSHAEAQYRTEAILLFPVYSALNSLGRLLNSGKTLNMIFIILLPLIRLEKHIKISGPRITLLP